MSFSTGLFLSLRRVIASYVDFIVNLHVFTDDEPAVTHETAAIMVHSNRPGKYIKLQSWWYIFTLMHDVIEV
jgi:hypothetical protein